MQNLPEFEKIKNYLTTLKDQLDTLKREEDLAAEISGNSKEAIEDMIILFECGEKRRKTELKIAALAKYINSVESLPPHADVSEATPPKSLEKDLYCNRESHNDFILAILSFFNTTSTLKLLIEDFLSKAALAPNPSLNTVPH